jgi:hypothetical protein
MTAQQTAQQITTSEHPVSDAARQVVNDGTSVLHDAKDAAMERMKRPTTTAAITGAAVMGAAMLVGVLETAVGCAAAYVTYRLIEKDRAREVAGAEAAS